MDRLDEALHNVHYKLAVGGNQLASGREYRGRVEGIYWEGIPTVASLAGKAQIDRQRARVDLSGCQRSIDSIEFNQRQIDRGGTRFLDCDPGRHAGLPSLGQHSDFLSAELCKLSDLLSGHDKGFREIRRWRRQNYDVSAFKDFFRDRHGSGMGELPIAADKPGRSLRTSDRNGRQGHIDPSLLEETGFGSEPGGALPCRKQPGCDSDTLRSRRRDLRPSEVRCGRQRGGTRYQTQKVAAEKFHLVLPIASECARSTNIVS